MLVLEARRNALPPPEPIWRIGQLGSDSNISVVELIIGHRPLLAALAAAHLSHTEAQRLTKSLAAVRNIQRLGPKGGQSSMLDQTTQRRSRHEFAASPADASQARRQAPDDA